MSILTDMEILEAMVDKEPEIKIAPFDPDLLRGITYDLRIGGECYIGGSKDKIILSDKPGCNTGVAIPSRQFAILETLETLTLGPHIAGRFGLISKYSKKGLVFLSGPVVDPTFSGSIKIGLYNTGSKPIYIQYKDPICTIIFYKVKEIKNLPTDLDNIGRGIKSDDVNYIVTHHSFSSLEGLEKRLSKLEILAYLLFAIITGIVISGIIGVMP